MTHCRELDEKSRLCWRVGSATFTMVASSTTMNCARQTITSTSHGRDTSREVVADGAFEVMGLPVGDEADDPIRLTRGTVEKSDRGVQFTPEAASGTRA